MFKTNVVEDRNKNTIYNDYVINVGDELDALEPIDSAPTFEEAMAIAIKSKAKIQEVVYSPANDPDYPDYVVWRNRQWGPKNKSKKNKANKLQEV